MKYPLTCPQCNYLLTAHPREGRVQQKGTTVRAFRLGAVTSTGALRWCSCSVCSSAVDLGDAPVRCSGCAAVLEGMLPMVYL